MKIKKGSLVTLHYTGRFEDGSVFDTSENKIPIQFRVGSGAVIAGLDDAVIGMGTGDKKTIMLRPEKAFGQRDESLIKDVPKGAFKNADLKKGDILKLSGPDGKALLLTVVDVSGNNLKIDLNHPFAGKNVKFDIAVVGVE